MTTSSKNSEPLHIEVLTNLYLRDKWFVYEFLAYVGYIPVGYLRVEQLSIEQCNKDMPTVWHFKNIIDGWCFDLKDIYKTWMAAHMYARKVPASSDQTSWFGWQSTRPSDDIMRSDLVALDNSCEYTKQWKSFLRQRKDLPIVSWIEVEKPHRCQGVATFLYSFAARELAKKNLSLFSSTLQSDAAAKCWNKMFMSGLLPITISHRLCPKTHDGPKYKRFEMDLRTKET